MDKGFREYFSIDTPTLSQIHWCIPNELVNNTIVESKMKAEPFMKIYDYINKIEFYKSELKHRYLDIEKIPIREKIDKLKTETIKLLDEVDKDLSPYYWVIKKLSYRDYYFMLDDEKPNYFRKEILNL